MAAVKSKPDRPPEFQRESIHVASLSDQPTADDALGFKPYVDAIAEFLTAPATRPPLTISIEGKWGSGKTSFMDQLEEKLHKEYGKLTVKFNAWRHDEEKSLWAAFAMELLDQLPKHSCLAHTPEASIVRRWMGHLKLIGMRFKWKSAWLDTLPILLLGAVAICATLFFTFFGVENLDRFSSTYKDLLKKLTGIGGVSASVAILAAIWKNLIGKIQNPMDIDLNKYMSCPDYEGHVSFIENFQNDFQKIIKAYAGDEPVYVFIDDVDRCQLLKAAELMKALNLMLSSNPKLIFIIGMDREKVAAGMASDYEKIIPYLLHAQGDHKAAQEENIDPAHGIRFAYNFIEKFIQLHFQVPLPERDDLQGFLDKMGAPEEESEADQEGQKDVDPVDKFFSDLWIFLRNEWRKTIDLIRGKPVLPDEGEAQPTSAAPDEKPPVEGQLEKEKEERREMIRLELDRDSETVKEIALLLAPHFDNNPRRVIQFINIFRLRAYIANETGLFDEVKGEKEQVPLTFEQLGKFVTISLKWPLLISELVKTPDLLNDMQYYALQEEDKRQDMGVNVAKWLREEGMIDFLREGIRSKDDSEYLPDNGKFLLTVLNAKDLLKVSPAVPRSEIGPSPPGKIKIDLSQKEPEEMKHKANDVLDRVKESYEAARSAEGKGDLKEAERLYREAIEIGESSRESPFYGRALHTIGRVAHKQGRINAAIELYEKAIHIFEEMGRDSDAEQARKLRDDILKQKGKDEPTTPDSQLSVIETIRFNYAPKSPTAFGWKISPKIPQSWFPNYDKGFDPEYGDYLRIKPSKDYALNYALAPELEKAKQARFIIKAGNMGRKYIRVRRQSKEDQSSVEPGWIYIRPDMQSPRKDSRTDDEWIIGIPPKQLQRGWVSQSIDVEDAFNRTFGTEECVYGGLMGFRIRDEIEIAKIELLGISEAHENV